MKLFLNSLTFRYPTEPVTCYFSSKNDEKKKSDMLKSKTLYPQEVIALMESAGVEDLPVIYTSYDKLFEGFKSIDIDFNNPDNEDYVKRYYNQKLKQILSKHDELMFTQSGITNDLQVWVYNGQEQRVSYLGAKAKVWTLDRFTLKVRFDSLNSQPYLLIASDRPALLLGVPLKMLGGNTNDDPFSPRKECITPALVNKVMTRQRQVNGKYNNRRIERLRHLQERNLHYDPSETLPVLTQEMKHFLGLYNQGKREWSSKYVKYWEKISWFKDKYLTDESIYKVFNGLAKEFTPVKEHQVGQVDASKRMLRFAGQTKSNRPQEGINAGPARNCPNVEVRLIAIYQEADKDYASHLLWYFRDGNYLDQDEAKRKRLERYIGSHVDYALTDLHIRFINSRNPLPEIKEALNKGGYMNLNPNIKYVGIYLSPIHKYASEKNASECYYKVKETFLKRGIMTQCIDVRNMIEAINRDKNSRKKNFIYTLQNMGVAICAKIGGAPWLLDETTRKELIIGIGAFRTDNEQYIGAAFSFDNTGVLCDYNYFQPREFDELVGAIKEAIIKYTSVNNRPERLIIHYYKKLSMRREAGLIMDMLSSLGLDIPVYVVSINKTESEDLVLFDAQSIYLDSKGTHQSLMPKSGCWINLGHVREGYRFLLCNNTRYDDDKFRATDGFPFPVKLTICCFGGNADIDTPTKELLISQVYQFSRIYWRSVRQQGLPVTIKYPEMIAEMLPHFDNPTVYPEKNCLWFL